MLIKNLAVSGKRRNSLIDTFVKKITLIMTIKESVRCTVHGLKFKLIPILMCRAVVEKAVRDLNQFPAKYGIAENTSPLTMMTGKLFPGYNSLMLEFGTYVHIFEENDPSKIQTRQERHLQLP